MNEVKDIVKWTSDNADKVAQNILVPVQGFDNNDPYEYFANGTIINISKTALCQQKYYKKNGASDVYREVKKTLPKYAFNSFLGGTKRAEAPKWLFGLYIRSKKRYIGNIGTKSMEAIQNFHHLLFGTFLSFPKPWLYRNGWLLFFLGILDKTALKTFLSFIKIIISNPINLFRRLYFQSIIVMQPLDILDNGDLDMCDGCPNKTYWNGRLVSECRMEEYINYGTELKLVPKK